MKVSKDSGGKGLNGVVKCALGKNSATFVFKEGEQAGKRFTIKSNDLPEEMPTLENGKSYFVNMNNSGTRVFAIRPARGMFVVQVKDFARTTDEDFLIIRKVGDFGPYFQFIANLGIVEGAGEGAVVPLYLPLGNEGRPKFVDDGEGNIEMKGDITKIPFGQLVDLWRYSLGEETEVAFAEDVQELLSNLLSAMLKKKKKFFISMENGYVKSLSSDDDVEDDDIEDEETDEFEDVEDDDEEDEDLRK